MTSIKLPSTPSDPKSSSGATKVAPNNVPTAAPASNQRGAVRVVQPESANTYTLTYNGSAYKLTQGQIDWMKDRYQKSWKDNYKNTADDLGRSLSGAMPTAFEKSYKNDTLDKKLYDFGLPSIKYLGSLMADYDTWYGGGQTYNLDDAVKADVTNRFKSDWTYEYTLEDQARKKSGKMPVAIESKYGDTYRDYQLMQQGLPPEAMLSEYVGKYEDIQRKTQRKDQFYTVLAATMADAESKNGGAPLDDATKMQAYYSLLESPDWADVFDLHETSLEVDTEAPDTIAEYDAKIKARQKAEKASDEPFVSYADFQINYLPYKQKAITANVVDNAVLAAQKSGAIAGLDSKAAVQSYVQKRASDDPAVILQDMYDSGASLTRIRDARNELNDISPAQKKIVNAAFDEIKNKFRGDSSNSIFSPEYAQAAKQTVSDQWTQAYNAQQERKPKAEKAKTENNAIETGLVKPFESGATSTLSVDDANKIFRSNLMYDEKGRITGESVKLATNMLYDAGVSTSVVKEVGKLNGIPYNGIAIKNYTAMMAFQYNVNNRDLEQRQNLVDATRQKIVGSGTMTGFEYDQAVRRAGWSDALDTEQSAENYYTDYQKPRFEANGDQLPAWSELSDEERSVYVKDFKETSRYNQEIDKSPAEFARGRLTQVFVGALADINAGAVSLADMALAPIQGRTDTWSATKHFQNVQRELTSANVTDQSGATQAIGTVADVVQQLERAYVLSEIGSGIASMAFGSSGAISVISSSATSASTKGLNFLAKLGTFAVKSAPFIATSQGMYYAEAMENGASVGQATIYGTIGGIIEGATEAFGTELWIGRALGSNAVAKGILSAAKGTLKGGSIATKAVLINLVASSLGNGLEEVASYAGTWLTKMATYDKDAQFDWNEAWQNGKMGMLVGLFGAGLNMGADTNAGVIANFLQTEKGTAWLKENGDSAIQDLFIDTVIAEDQPLQFKNMIEYQDAVQSTEEYKATWNDIEATTRQLEDGNQKYEADIEKIDTELQAKQAAFDATLETYNAVTDTKKKGSAAKALRVATTELKVEQTQHEAKRVERTKAHKEVTEQQNIALKKAQTKLAAHSVGMSVAFAPEIEQIKSGNFDAETLGAQIVAKMNAARAGKLKDYVQAYSEESLARQAQAAEALKTLQAPTVQQSPENAPAGAEQGVEAQIAAMESAGNIKSEAIPLNAAETGDVTVQEPAPAPVVQATPVSNVFATPSAPVAQLSEEQQAERDRRNAEYERVQAEYAQLLEDRKKRDALEKVMDENRPASGELFLRTDPAYQEQSKRRVEKMKASLAEMYNGKKGLTPEGELNSSGYNSYLKLAFTDADMESAALDYEDAVLRKDESSMREFSTYLAGNATLGSAYSQTKRVNRLAAEKFGFSILGDPRGSQQPDVRPATVIRNYSRANQLWSTPTLNSSIADTLAWIENPEAARQAAPVRPEPEATSVKMTQPSSDALGIVDPRSQEMMNGLKRFGRGFYKRVVSGAAGTERVSRVQKKLSVGGVTLDASAQGVRNSNGTAQYILGDSLVDIDGTPIGKSFVDLFKEVPQEKWGDFEKYLLAKHTESRMSLEQRGYGNDKPVLASESGALDPDGNPSAMDANEAAALAARIESENPTFAKVRDEYRSWWRNFMRSWAVDGGLMTDVQFNALDAKYPDYVPTYRAGKNGVGNTSSATRNSVTISSAIKNATGSVDAIQDIRVSLSDLVKRYVAMERRNELVQNLYNFAELHTNAAAEFATIFDEESKLSPDVDFVSFDELANESAAEVKDGQYIIRGFRDGEKISMYVNKDVYDAVNYLTNPSDVSVKSNQINEVLRGARAVTKPIKGAITGYNPFFAITNFVRDAQTYFVNTNANAVNTFTNIGMAVSERAQNSDLWKSYLALGGNASGYITSQQMTDAKVTGKSKVTNAVDKAGKAIGWLGGYTENMFRFAEYINGVNKYGNTAEGRRNAMADASDVTVNFSRSGAYTKAADAFCLYLNANVQGLDKMARTIAKNPGKTVLRGLSLAAINLLVRYLTGNDDNPHYQNLTNYVKDANYCIPNVLGERDENGYCTTFVKIPKSREYGIIAATIERAARWADGESFNDAFSELNDSIGTSVGIQMEPFWTAAEAATTNKNYFGSDIVPMYMKEDAAPDQTNAQTSVISDAVSERLYEMGVEVSPMVLDYIVNQYGGFYGQLLTSATAKDSGGIAGVAANIIEDKFVVDPLYQSGVVSRFYDAKDEAQALARQSQREREALGIKAVSIDEARYKAFDSYTKEMAKLRKAERELLANELDTPERKKKIDAIREKINNVAADGLAAWNNR